jgi:TM2 domain-containing membrane protein YozV
MAFCATCGTKMRESAAFCTRCGSKRFSDRTTQIVARPGAPMASRNYYRLAGSTAPRAILLINQKSSGLAIVLSFFWPGLGQLYTGQILKGILMLIAYLPLAWIGTIALIAGLVTGGAAALFGFLALVGVFALWIYGMVDAYKCAESINQQQRIGF